MNALTDIIKDDPALVSQQAKFTCESRERP